MTIFLFRLRRGILDLRVLLGQLTRDGHDAGSKKDGDEMIPVRTSSSAHRRSLSSQALCSPRSLLNLCHRFTDELPGDPDTANIPRKVTGAAYSLVTPQPAPSPVCIAYSVPAASLIRKKPFMVWDAFGYFGLGAVLLTLTLACTFV